MSSPRRLVTVAGTGKQQQHDHRCLLEHALADGQLLDEFKEFLTKIDSEVPEHLGKERLCREIGDSTHLAQVLPDPDRW